jgi:hypothetical protein
LDKIKVDIEHEGMNMKGMNFVLERDLLLLIEQKRMQLIQTAEKDGLNSLKAIKHSQELDKLLNEYNRQKSEKYG